MNRTETATTQISLTPDMAALKARLKAICMAGDYTAIARPMEQGALAFLQRMAVPSGAAMLDIGCGAGQIAIPAARAGVRVTGLDIAPNLLARARTRANAEGLTVHFDEGDAELLPYHDDTFDVVVSLIGAMFAPQPERVAAEMVRVCQPSGRIFMANWTSEGLLGQMFKTIGPHLPLAPLMPSPLLWGDETTVRERLQHHVAELRLTRRQYPLHYAFGPADVVEFYREYDGPTHHAFAKLNANAEAALRHDLEQLWAQHNRATDETTSCESEYLEVAAVKPPAQNTKKEITQ